MFMLISQFVEVKWNPKTKKHFEDLGYLYTKMNDSFLVKVDDLKDGSNVRVKVKCDYCSNEYDIAWYSYILLKKKSNNTDCCSNPECTYKKSQESLLEKYGTSTLSNVDGVHEKRKQTNIEKYGVENPFASQEIQKKIRMSNKEKYGVEYTMQNKDIKEKSINTCIKKYGVSNYGSIYSSQHKGELSPTWKGGVKHHRVERSTFEYRQWRKNVFKKDSYTCQCCGDKSGNGHRVELCSHHIKNWKDNIDIRYDVENGITLCKVCHNKFHCLYVKRNNTKEQLVEFINLHR